MGRPRAAVFASGFSALDEALPGGGWPAGALTELLLPHPGVGELRLLAPVLVRLQREQHECCLMWFDPPALPSAWALQALGLVAQQMVVVRSQAEAALSLARAGASRVDATRADASRADARVGRVGPRSLSASSARSSLSSLWALEHALKSGHVGAVLAWLPARLPADALRRLQLAAQGHEGPAFLLRGEEAARQSSPAPLRLQLAAAAPDWLRVHVFKRRGPPLPQPLLLELAPVLGQPARLRARTGVRIAQESASLESRGQGALQGSQGQPQGSWA